MPSAVSAAAVPYRDYGPEFARITGNHTAAKTPPGVRLGPTMSITTVRLVPDDKAQALGHSASSGKCSVKILHAKPTIPARAVASIKINGTPAQHDDVWSLLKHTACEAGANAVLVNNVDRSDSEAGAEYHVEAVALVLDTANSGKHKSPVPKTITVPADASAAVPETITVAPDTAPAAKTVTVSPHVAEPKTLAVDSGTAH